MLVCNNTGFVMKLVTLHDRNAVICFSNHSCCLHFKPQNCNNLHHCFQYIATYTITTIHCTNIIWVLFFHTTTDSNMHLIWSNQRLSLTVFRFCNEVCFTCKARNSKICFSMFVFLFLQYITGKQAYTITNVMKNRNNIMNNQKQHENI